MLPGIVEPVAQAGQPNHSPACPGREKRQIAVQSKSASGSCYSRIEQFPCQQLCVFTGQKQMDDIELRSLTLVDGKQKCRLKLPEPVNLNLSERTIRAEKKH